MAGKKRFAINLVANFVSSVTVFAVSFFITPYIVKSIGKEAYGFCGLAWNFILYAGIATIAINSMTGRFVLIKYHKDDMKGANTFFNSALIANALLAIVMLIPGILCVAYIEHIVQVPTDLLTDVRWLFALTVIGFILSTLGATVSVATFVKNRVDIASVKSIAGSLLRLTILVVLYGFFKPTVVYMGVAFVAVILFDASVNTWLVHKLLPEIKYSVRSFSLPALKELYVSGMWNAANSVGMITAKGLDLLIANIFVGPSAMGALAVGKTIPTLIGSLITALSSSQTPQLTIHYAKDDPEALWQSLVRSFKVLGAFTAIAIAMLIVFGKAFYTLWVPNEDSRLLMVISTVYAAEFMFSGSIDSLFSVFTITNRLKVSSLVYLCVGILNLVLVLAIVPLISSENAATLVVAGVSSVLYISSACIFVPFYAAKCLKVNAWRIYPYMLRPILACGLIIALGEPIKWLINTQTWLNLITIGIVTLIIGIFITLFVVFQHHDRKLLIEAIASKLKRRLIKV